MRDARPLRAPPVTGNGTAAGRLARRSFGLRTGPLLLALGVLALIGPTVAVDGVFGPRTLSAQTSSRPEVASLRFQGNDSFSDDALAAAIVTRQTRCASFVFQPFCWAGADFAWNESYLNPRTLRQDHVRIQVFYWQRGYRDARIDTTITPIENDRVDILFEIDEGEPHRITSLDFTGLEGIGDVRATDLPVGVGDPLDLGMLDVARDTLSRRLRNRGFAHTDVLRNIFIPSGTREAEVEFDVYTGPRAYFGPVAISGNEEVTESVVLRMLPLNEGDLYRRELVLDAQRNLYGLEIFRYASITEDLDHQPDSIVPLQVQVNEGNSHRVRAGGGWNTEECFNAETRWTSRNFFGGARRLVLRGRASNLLNNQLEDNILCSGAGSGEYGELDWVLSADFTQPFILSPRNSFAASVYAERQSLQNVFVRRAVGLNLGITRSITRTSSLTPYYRPQLAALDAGEVFFCTSFLVCDPTDIDLLQASNVLAPVGLSFSQDQSNQVVNPTGGYIALVDLETAQPWTGSDFRYHRAVAEVSTYYGIDPRWVIAGRLRGGWLKPGVFEGLSVGSMNMDRRIAHPEKRFYAGGSNSVRGYAQNALGPQVVSIQVTDLVLPRSKADGAGDSAVCTPEQLIQLTCDASALGDERFFARPTGGTRLLEGSLEIRFPVWGPALGGAAFVDLGHVWNGDRALSFDDLSVTPGFGLRYSTPIGPVRVDLAYRGTPARELPVVTSQIRPFDPGLGDEPSDRIGFGTPDEIDWVRAEDLALLGPRVRIGDEVGGGVWSEFWNGVQLHLSIGQAF